MTEKNVRKGGYDEGYLAVPCFWGKEPGSLVRYALKNLQISASMRVLDLGCGEGKNAATFARLGCMVEAVDCSAAALENGALAFPDTNIQWHEADCLSFDCGVARYDVVVAYGLLHCLASNSEAEILIERLQAGTKPGGINVICAFNERSQDLSAHPNFHPLLLSHTWYTARYEGWELIHCTDEDLYETHPHNGVPHHHSLTRLIARKT